MHYYSVIRSEESDIYHHGILGMHWGIRRFQNKDGSLTSAGRDRYGVEGKRKASEDDSKKSGLTDKQKKAIKIGAAVAVTVLAAYGGYKLANSPKGKQIINRVLAKNKDVEISEISSTFAGGTSEVGRKIGKTISDIDTKMVSQINVDGWDGGNPPRLTKDYSRNCTHTALAYIMNSVLGKNVSAKGYGGVDEISGLVMEKGRDIGIYDAIFDGLDKMKVPNTDYRPDKAITHIKKGTTGILRFANGLDGHVVNYECDKFGNITIIDPQINHIYTLDKAIASKLKFDITDILDFSNATLKEDASKILDYLVK